MSDSRTVSSSRLLGVKILGIHTAVDELYFTGVMPRVPVRLHGAGLCQAISRAAGPCYTAVSEVSPAQHGVVTASAFAMTIFLIR